LLLLRKKRGHHPFVPALFEDAQFFPPPPGTRVMTLPRSKTSSLLQLSQVHLHLPFLLIVIPPSEFLNCHSPPFSGLLISLKLPCRGSLGPPRLYSDILLPLNAARCTGGAKTHPFRCNEFSFAMCFPHPNTSRSHHTLPPDNPPEHRHHQLSKLSSLFPLEKVFHWVARFWPTEVCIMCFLVFPESF